MAMRWVTMVGFAAGFSVRVFALAAPEDDYGSEAYAVFDHKLQAFVQAPSGETFKDLPFLCSQLPVREKLPGQVGSGHPGEREAKLKCMLKLLAAMDGAIKEHLPVAYMNVWVEGVPISGMSPDGVKDPLVRDRYVKAIEANDRAVAENNFQLGLQETRKKYARFIIPNYLRYDYPLSEKNQHLQQIISDALKPDPKAGDVLAALLKQAATR